MSTVTKSSSEAIDNTDDSANVQRRMPMNGILVPAGTKVTGARGSSFGRFQRSQLATRRRVKVNAVNTVVAMPMAKVTAKPLTGPVPSQNSTAVAISAVTLESMIVF